MFELTSQIPGVTQPLIVQHSAIVVRSLRLPMKQQACGYAASSALTPALKALMKPRRKGSQLKVLDSSIFATRWAELASAST